MYGAIVLLLDRVKIVSWLLWSSRMEAAVCEEKCFFLIRLKALADFCRIGPSHQRNMFSSMKAVKDGRSA